ncbi:hypothetical protein [Mesorhizobium sp.]|uniref:hypothetical protein n=1 Tax=Mesorhizobium sp. TaxID=1871066 RepID=UPI0025EF5E74|nr:hypothetical protein [Mesorhizobium sp.]
MAIPPTTVAPLAASVAGMVQPRVAELIKLGQVVDAHQRVKDASFEGCRDQ